MGEDRANPFFSGGLKAPTLPPNPFYTMKITHIITGLDNDGAEAVLYHVIKNTVEEMDHSVVSLRDAGFFGQKLTDLGVEVFTLNMSKNFNDLLSSTKILGILNRQKPDIVQTWLYHANLAGGAIAAITGLKKIIWGIHHCSLQHDKLTTRLIAKMCGFLSATIPSAVVFCSKEAALVHNNMGYSKSKTHVIQNGYDLSRFKPDLNARRELRNAWNIEDGETLIGMVGRWHPCKDHGNLLSALSLLKAEGANFRCVLVGPEISHDNEELVGLCKQHGLVREIILTGPRTDIPEVMNAVDVHVLSSLSEAFPNVIAEAMASGTPCAATDVGDTREIIGNAKWIAPPENPKLLAEAIAAVIKTVKDKGRDQVGFQCRRRIVQNFSLERMVASYKSLWKGVSVN